MYEVKAHMHACLLVLYDHTFSSHFSTIIFTDMYTCIPLRIPKHRRFSFSISRTYIYVQIMSSIITPHMYINYTTAVPIDSSNTTSLHLHTYIAHVYNKIPWKSQQLVYRRLSIQVHGCYVVYNQCTIQYYYCASPSTELFTIQYQWRDMGLVYLK